MTAPPRKGRFITLEGGEGAGKSTLLRALAARIEGTGASVVTTREPGGSPKAERLREILLSGAIAPLGPFAETLLFAAARDDHLETTIRPALARGAIVLCDRFADSTRAYQGVVGGVETPVLNAIERVVVGRTRPDLTLILDLDPAVGLARAKARSSAAADRFEREDASFHRKLRDAFLTIARNDPQRCVVIDAAAPPAAVEAAAWAAVRERLKLGLNGAAAS